MSDNLEAGKQEIRDLLKESLVPESLIATVEEVLNASLDRGDSDLQDVTRRVISSVVEGLSHQKDGELRLRSVSEAAVLTVARRWGNVVHAGKATVEATQRAAEVVGMNPRKATEQATIGAADGVLRVGPIAYPHLKRELSGLVEDIDTLLANHRNLPAVYEPVERPVIVPMGEVEELDSFEQEWLSEEDEPAPALVARLAPKLDTPRRGFLGRMWEAVRRLNPFHRQDSSLRR